MWPGASGEEQSFARSRAVTSFACRSHADIEEHYLFLPPRRLGIRVLQVQVETTSGRQHAGRISSSASSGQSRSVDERCHGAIRVPQPETQSCLFLSTNEDRPEDRASSATTFGRENNSSTLCSQHQ